MTTFRTLRLFHESNRQENRFVIQNDNATAPILPNDYDTINYRGKFFHRGCHGWIESITLFIRNLGAAQNVTVGIANFPDATEDSSYVVNCPPGDNWVTFDVQQQWNYDGLFVYVSAHGANTSLAFDVDEPARNHDAYRDTSALIDGTGPYTRVFTAVDPLARASRRYHIRVNVSQSVGDVPVTGFVNIKEVDDFLRVVLTDESGNITGIPLPLFGMTIIGSDEAYFNAILNGDERQKNYAAGDPHTGGWSVGRDFYPYSVTIILRAEHDNALRPPCLLEYEGVYVAITSSDGQRVFTATLGRDRNIDWDLLTIDGNLHWTAVYHGGQEEIQYRNISSDVSMTILVKNSSGVQLDAVEIYIMGSSHPIA